MDRPPPSASSTGGGGLTCRILGHRYRFWHVGAELRWRCERECGAEGSKEYATPEDAARYAAAFDREDGDDTGRRASLSMLFERLTRRGRRRP